MKILFISSNRIGDAILSTGLLAHLVAHYPEARFTIVAGPLTTELFAAVPRLDAIIPLQKQSWNRHWLALWRRCAGTRWDIIVDLRNSLVSRLLGHGRLYTHAGGADDMHKVRQNAAILGLDPPPAPHLWLSPAILAEAAALLPEGGPVLALGPAANWYPKQWPAEHFAALASALPQEPGLDNCRILVLAAAHERDAILPVIAAIPPERRVEVIGASLALAAACLARSRLFVGNDSGLMHLAAAMGTPTLGLFGPGYEKIYGPWGGTVLRTTESTAELLAKLPHPGAAAPNLMASLPVATVMAGVRDLLKKDQ